MTYSAELVTITSQATVGPEDALWLTVPLTGLFAFAYWYFTPTQPGGRRAPQTSRRSRSWGATTALLLLALTVSAWTVGAWQYLSDGVDQITYVELAGTVASTETENRSTTFRLEEYPDLLLEVGHWRGGDRYRQTAGTNVTTYCVTTDPDPRDTTLECQADAPQMSGEIDTERRPLRG
ncbi:hypothetical protein [Demequina litorisediminis]|uniref:Uncharacterized protein n=1 Tax=Demequina litorisediminis TaxID=1849022 RepID=A0ABQ6IIV7_9MICO|nr:hypothetical protein [Demequina litorisediminis]GMA37779.1 hypothetical protein GCM10025876_39830 [Demequina litorisediminis]GMA37839.1 hypothetical protein GCM10025876_40430 [Demequina litorisediminis]GMA37901.1 hypothetical protein GCM10025876_41050 [Demequina litorisediminis]